MRPDDITTRKMSAEELARGVVASRTRGEDVETRRMEALELEKLIAVEPMHAHSSRERRGTTRTRRMRALMKPLARMSVGTSATSRRSVLHLISACFATCVLAILLFARRWFH